MANEENIQSIENLLQAIDIIASKRASANQYDKTVRVTIVDDSEAEKGIYKVSYGSAIHTACSLDTIYHKDDNVYMTIPSGDASQTKFIVGRYFAPDQMEYISYDEKANFINMTDSITTDLNESYEITQLNQSIKIWPTSNDDTFENQFLYLQNYDQLMLQSTFVTDIQNAQTGSYGLYLDIYIVDEPQPVRYQLTSDDLLGNIYAFNTGTTKTKIFDISQLGVITSIELFFVSQDFNSQATGTITARDIDIAFGYDINDIPEETALLYTTENTLYDAAIATSTQEEIKQTNAEYYATMDAINEDETLTDEEREASLDTHSQYYENKLQLLINTFEETITRNLKVRLIQNQDNHFTAIDYDNELPNTVNLHWYRYNPDQITDDLFAGKYWQEIKENQSLALTTNLLTNMPSTQFKVILEDRASVLENFLSQSDNAWNILLANDVEDLTLYDSKDNQYTTLSSFINKALEAQWSVEDIWSFEDYQQQLTESNLLDSTQELIDNVVSEWNVFKQNNTTFYVSNILEFVNIGFKTTDAASQLINSLSITSSTPTYMGYETSGSIYNPDAINDKHTLTARYNMVFTGFDDFDYYDTISWYIPLENTMIREPEYGHEYTATSSDSLIMGGEQVTTELTQEDFKYFTFTGKYLKITRMLEPFTDEDIIDNHVARCGTQTYRIKGFYVPNTNNTIFCKVTKNGQVAIAHLTLLFGTKGTNGLQMSLQLAMHKTVPVAHDESYTTITKESAFALPLNGSVGIVPHVFNEDGQEVTANDNIEVQYQWISPQKIALDAINNNTDIKIKLADLVVPSYPNSVILQPREDIQLRDCRYYILEAIVKWTVPSYKRDQYGNYLYNQGSLVEDEEYARVIKVTEQIPIPVCAAEAEEFGIAQVTGPQKITYNAIGANPTYFDGAYAYFRNWDQNIDTEEYSVQYHFAPTCESQEYNNPQHNYNDVALAYPKWDNNARTIIPQQLYGFANSEIAPLYSVDLYAKKIYSNGAEEFNQLIWTYPIYISQEKYASSLLNDWDGSLTIDPSKEGSKILATMMGAGYKTENNTFSGVVMGEVSGVLPPEGEGNNKTYPKSTGLYGINNGQFTFGLNTDGTAFLGNAGSGQIKFDGTKGVIQSSNYNAEQQKGTYIDLDDGRLITGDGVFHGSVSAHEFHLTDDVDYDNMNFQLGKLVAHNPTSALAEILEERKSQATSQELAETVSETFVNRNIVRGALYGNPYYDSTNWYTGTLNDNNIISWSKQFDRWKLQTSSVYDRTYSVFGTQTNTLIVAYDCNKIYSEFADDIDISELQYITFQADIRLDAITSRNTGRPVAASTTNLPTIKLDRFCEVKTDGNIITWKWDQSPLKTYAIPKLNQWIHVCATCAVPRFIAPGDLTNNLRTYVGFLFEQPQGLALNYQYYVRNVKYELGKKESLWSPAPEDLLIDQTKLYLDQPALPYRKGDLWFKDGLTYICTQTLYSTVTPTNIEKYWTPVQKNLSYNLLKHNSLCEGAAPNASTVEWEIGANEYLSTQYTLDGLKCNTGQIGNSHTGNLTFNITELFSKKILTQADTVTFSCDVKLLPKENSNENDPNGEALTLSYTLLPHNNEQDSLTVVDDSNIIATTEKWTRLYVTMPGNTSTTYYTGLIFTLTSTLADLKFIVRDIKLEKNTIATWEASEKIDVLVRELNTDIKQYLTNYSLLDATDLMLWHGLITPTTATFPAVQWDTSELKQQHLGDLYIETPTQEIYKWTFITNDYEWQKISTNIPTKLLYFNEDVNLLIGTAPQAPYDTKILWYDITNMQLKSCIKENTDYTSSDWVTLPSFQLAEDLHVVQTIDVEYILWTSLTETPPTNPANNQPQWKSVPDTWVQDRYIWSRQKMTYKDGTISYSNPACITGAQGKAAKLLSLSTSANYFVKQHLEDYVKATVATIEDLKTYTQENSEQLSLGDIVKVTTDSINGNQTSYYKRKDHEWHYTTVCYTPERMDLWANSHGTITDQELQDHIEWSIGVNHNSTMIVLGSTDAPYNSQKARYEIPISKLIPTITIAENEEEPNVLFSLSQHHTQLFIDSDNLLFDYVDIINVKCQYTEELALYDTMDVMRVDGTTPHMVISSNSFDAIPTFANNELAIEEQYAGDSGFSGYQFSTKIAGFKGSDQCIARILGTPTVTQSSSPTGCMSPTISINNPDAANDCFIFVKFPKTVGVNGVDKNFVVADTGTITARIGLYNNLRNYQREKSPFAQHTITIRYAANKSGKGIKSIEEQYCLSSKNIRNEAFNTNGETKDIPNSTYTKSWGTTQVNWTQEKPYIWTRSKITYDTNELYYTDAQCSALSDITKTLYDNLLTVQEQVDGVIAIYHGSGAPTITYSSDAQEQHVGDLYLDLVAKNFYRYEQDELTAEYGWVLQTDDETFNLLKGAQHIFTNIPYTPYSEGDFWIDTTSGVIYRCQTSKSNSEKYDPRDWELFNDWLNRSNPNLLIRANLCDLSEAITPAIDANWKFIDALSADQKTATKNGLEITLEKNDSITILPLPSLMNQIDFTKPYTFSCEAKLLEIKVPAQATELSHQLCMTYAVINNESEILEYNEKTESIDNIWAQLSIQYPGYEIASSINKKIVLGLKFNPENNDKIIILVRNLKLEQGKFATSWEFTDEDIQEQLQNARYTNEIIVGTQQNATRFWEGYSNSTYPYDGMTIRYYTPYSTKEEAASSGGVNRPIGGIYNNNSSELTITEVESELTVASNIWLNLSYADGKQFGWIPCFTAAKDGTRLTNIPQGVTTQLEYKTLTINDSTYTGWWEIATENISTNVIYESTILPDLPIKAEILLAGYEFTSQSSNEVSIHYRPMVYPEDSSSELIYQPFNYKQPLLYNQFRIYNNTDPITTYIQYDAAQLDAYKLQSDQIVADSNGFNHLTIDKQVLYLAGQLSEDNFIPVPVYCKKRDDDSILQSIYIQNPIDTIVHNNADQQDYINDNWYFLSLGIWDTSEKQLQLFPEHYLYRFNSKGQFVNLDTYTYEASAEAISIAAEAKVAVEEQRAAQEIIIGTQSAITNVWTGDLTLSELKAGQRISYWLPVESNGLPVTLQLTLSTGDVTGKIACYNSNFTPIINEYHAGDVISLVYCVNKEITGIADLFTGWVVDDTQNNTGLDYHHFSRRVTPLDYTVWGTSNQGTTSHSQHCLIVPQIPGPNAETRQLLQSLQLLDTEMQELIDYILENNLQQGEYFKIYAANITPPTTGSFEPGDLWLCDPGNVVYMYTTSDQWELLSFSLLITFEHIIQIADVTNQSYLTCWITNPESAVTYGDFYYIKTKDDSTEKIYRYIDQNSDNSTDESTFFAKWRIFSDYTTLNSNTQLKLNTFLTQQNQQQLEINGAYYSPPSIEQLTNWLQEPTKLTDGGFSSDSEVIGAQINTKESGLLEMNVLQSLTSQEAANKICLYRWEHPTCFVPSASKQTYIFSVDIRLTELVSDIPILPMFTLYVDPSVEALSAALGNISEEEASSLGELTPQARLVKMLNDATSENINNYLQGLQWVPLQGMIEGEWSRIYALGALPSNYDSTISCGFYWPLGCTQGKYEMRNPRLELLSESLDTFPIIPDTNIHTLGLVTSENISAVQTSLPILACLDGTAYEMCYPFLQQAIKQQSGYVRLNDNQDTDDFQTSISFDTHEPLLWCTSSSITVDTESGTAQIVEAVLSGYTTRKITLELAQNALGTNVNTLLTGNDEFVNTTKLVYLKGQLNNNIFTIATNHPYITSTPTTTGYHYYLLGYLDAWDADDDTINYSFTLLPEHPIYSFVNNQLTLLTTAGYNLTLDLPNSSTTKSDGINLLFSVRDQGSTILINQENDTGETTYSITKGTGNLQQNVERLTDFYYKNCQVFKAVRAGGHIGVNLTTLFAEHYHFDVNTVFTYSIFNTINGINNPYDLQFYIDIVDQNDNIESHRCYLEQPNVNGFDWQRVSCTFTLSADLFQAMQEEKNVLCYWTSNTYRPIQYWAAPKLECGPTATEWTLSTLDLTYKVDYLTAQKLTKEIMESSITETNAWDEVLKIKGVIESLASTSNGKYSLLEQVGDKMTFQMGNFFDDLATLKAQVDGEQASLLSTRLNELDQHTKYITFGNSGVRPFLTAKDMEEALVYLETIIELMRPYNCFLDACSTAEYTKAEWTNALAQRASDTEVYPTYHTGMNQYKRADTGNIYSYFNEHGQMQFTKSSLLNAINDDKNTFLFDIYWLYTQIQAIQDAYAVKALDLLWDAERDTFSTQNDENEEITNNNVTTLLDVFSYTITGYLTDLISNLQQLSNLVRADEDFQQAILPQANSLQTAIDGLALRIDNILEYLDAHKLKRAQVKTTLTENEIAADADENDTGVTVWYGELSSIHSLLTAALQELRGYYTDINGTYDIDTAGSLLYEIRCITTGDYNDFDIDNFDTYYANYKNHVMALQSALQQIIPINLKESLTRCVTVFLANIPKIPTIEMGADGDAFKVQITNRALNFIQNGQVVAYVNHNKFYNTTGVIRNELRIVQPYQANVYNGPSTDTNREVKEANVHFLEGFAWKTRQNGHMGLRWLDIYDDEQEEPTPTEYLGQKIYIE